MNGVAVPSSIHSEVKARLFGKALINIEFANYRIDSGASALASGASDSH